MSYLIQERGRHEPPACPGCLKRHHVEWVECTNIAQAAKGERWVTPGRDYCVTPGCSYSLVEKP